MKKILTALLAGVFVLGLFSLVQAGKPTRDDKFIGNGFPSGPHFNLNIKAKNDSFVCPSEEEVMKYYCPDDSMQYGTPEECDGLCEADCIAIYGNVINFPQGNGENNYTILMESGREKPKGKPTTANYPDLLEVTDWCMGFNGGDDKAAFRIPADPDGYAVYARLTGDPKEDPIFDFTNPQLAYVEDGEQDLIWLGYVSGGVFYPTGDEAVSRTQGKGPNKATDITSLFMWTGDVCTFIDWGYGDELEQCCIDNNPDHAGYDECVAFPMGYADQCCINNNGIYEGCIDPNFEEPSCNEGYEYVAGYLPVCTDNYAYEVVYCTIYEEPVWVFNIAEFVGMLFDIDPQGEYKASLIQIRFYPLPLNVKAQ